MRKYIVSVVLTLAVIGLGCLLPHARADMTLLGAGTGGLAAAPTATFDPSHLGSQNTLSGGNLIVSSGTAANGYYYARTVTSHSTGKYYFEFAIAQAANSDVTFGLVNATESLGPLNPGFTANSAAGYSNSGNFVINSLTIGTIPILFTAHTVGVAVDLGAGLIWIRDTPTPGTWNAGGTANPATAVGGLSLATLSGPYFAAASVYSVTGNSATANFGATGYVATAPSGFGNW